MRQLLKSRVAGVSVFGLLGIFLFVLSFIISPLAHAGVWDTRNVYHGYYDNQFGHSSSPYPDSAGPVLPNNDYAIDSIPGSVNSTGALYQFLYDKYTHTGPYGGTNAGYLSIGQAVQWDITGSSFIVNTMLGRTAGQASRTITAADWNSLNSRLQGVNFSIEDLYTDSFKCVNTYYQFQRNDVAYYKRCGEQNWAIVLRSKTTNAIEYVIYYRCANPIGNFGGIPDVNYTLTPTISVNPTIAEAASGNAAVSPVVNNNGAAASGVTWQVVSFVTTSIPGGGIDSRAPIAHYGNGATVIASGNGTFGAGNTGLPVSPQPIPDAPPGSYVCFAVSVQPYQYGNPNWNNSTPACITIATSPKVHVLGSDLIVGTPNGVGSPVAANVSTSTSPKNTGVSYGSWVEYGMLLTGTVKGMASAAGYSGGAPTSSQCAVSLLTFSNQVGNSCSNTQIGKYTLSTPLPQVASRFPVSASTPMVSGNVDITALAANQTYTSNGSADINLSASTPIPVGKWIVINAPNARVVITGDIKYTTATLHALSDIPQVVIIAKNIVIASNVVQVDSWLMATGTGVDGRLNTCGAGPGITEATLPNATQCSQPLQVNGPVSANHLIMRRTGGSGSGAAAATPAEVFNLRADAYLWSTSYSPGDGRVPTVSTVELPPRF